MTRDRVAYFRILTAAWVAYFRVAQELTLKQGLVVRTLLGTGSFYAMLAISIFGSKRIFPMLKNLGFLSADEPA